MRCKWGIGRGIESGDADGAGKCISGISEMEAIARRLVLKSGNLETLEGCFGCNGGGGTNVFLSKRERERERERERGMLQEKCQQRRRWRHL